MEQGTISQIENPDYGQLSFETVLAVGRGLDCAFIGKYVPFSELRKWVEDSAEDADLVPSFDEENKEAQMEPAEKIPLNKRFSLRGQDLREEEKISELVRQPKPTDFGLLMPEPPRQGQSPQREAA